MQARDIPPGLPASDENTKSECKRTSVRTGHARISRSVGQVRVKKRAVAPPLSKGITRPLGDNHYV